jgi:hypothetical protein
VRPSRYESNDSAAWRLARFVALCPLINNVWRADQPLHMQDKTPRGSCVHTERQSRCSDEMRQWGGCAYAIFGLGCPENRAAGHACVASVSKAYSIAASLVIP